MSSELSPEIESYLAQQVAIGTYQSRNDAIEAGVELLRKRDALLVRLDESRRQLDEGDYVEFDQEGLRQYFEGLKERARKRVESNQK